MPKEKVPKICAYCGMNEEEAKEINHTLLEHHISYKKPEMTVWLCTGCHWKTHGGDFYATQNQYRKLRKDLTKLQKNLVKTQSILLLLEGSTSIRLRSLAFSVSLFMRNFSTLLGKVLHFPKESKRWLEKSEELDRRSSNWVITEKGMDKIRSDMGLK